MTTQLSTTAISGSQSTYQPSQSDSDDLSSVRQDLTTLFDESNLTGVHFSRTTQTGCRLDDRRLSQFLPTPPSKLTKDSWIWLHGERVSAKADPSIRYFLCRQCFEARPSIVRFYDVSNQTSGALKHLEQKHNLTKAGLKVVPAKRRNPFEIAQRVEQARNETINPDEWQARFIKWVVMDNISLRQASPLHLHELFECTHPSAREIHYTSHNSIRKLIQVSVEQARPQVVQKLHMARSRISFSFDAWSSRSHLPFLGIYAHFIDEDYRLATCLLALKYLEGRHTGERLGTVLFEVLTTYDLTGKIGWFVADNASSNDTTLRKLSQLTQLELPEQRLRCLGHVLNLACQAMLHGTNADDFEHIDIENIDLEAIDRTASKFINQLSSLSDEELLDMWRRKGFYGKAHNFVVYVNRSPQRIQAFKAKQRELDESTTFLYSLLADGGVRWNSAYAMFERHIKLKDAVTAFQNDQRDAGELDEEDYLTPENWREMVEFKELLEPFKEATMRTQGQAKDGTHGALWEWLTELELLMEILENKKTQLLKQPPSFLRTCVNLAWSKLDNYYRLSDDTFAYRLAIVLNPNFRYDWFEEHWGKRAPHEVRELKRRMQDIFHDYKSKITPVTDTQPRDGPRELSRYEESNKVKKRKKVKTELERYLTTDIEEVSDVLAWWKAHQATYPVLSQMAFDVLAIPAMSAEVERLFSSAGLVITKRRARTLPDLAEEAQLLKAWLKERRVTLWPSEAPLTTLATTTVDEILV
ncbi:hypothetical protein KCU73_g314, partial [Aureobasidium melanogenum]